MKKVLLLVARAVVVSALALTPSLATAANFACKGRAIYVATGAEGNVYINVGYGVWSICSMETALNGVTAKTCQNWYSAALSSNLSGKSIAVSFNSDHPVNTGITSCPAMGTWVARAPYFLASDE